MNNARVEDGMVGAKHFAAEGVDLPPALRPDWFDPEQLTRLASELEELNLRLHGGEHDKFRPGIVCAAALLRAVTRGVLARDPTQQEKPHGR